MKIPNYSSRDMAIHAAADMEKALQTPTPESPFQMGDFQLKAIRELDNFFDTETIILNRDEVPTPPFPLTKKISKLTRLKDYTDSPPRVDPDEKYKYREQKISSQTQETPPSAATRKNTPKH